MSSYLPLLNEYDINCTKLWKAVDVILPDILTTIIKWGCKKTSDQTYHDFLKEKIPSNQWTSYVTKFQHNQAELNAKDCGTFDTDFLFKLIPEVCEHIAPSCSDAWTKADDTKIEWVLSRAQNIQNLCRKSNVSAHAARLFQELEEVTENLLNKAERLYFCMNSNKGKERSEDILKDKQLLQYKKELRFNGKDEMKKSLDKYDRVPLPFSDQELSLGDVFHCISVTIEDGKKRRYEIFCRELILHCQNKWIILVGPGGSGKSTLLRRILGDILEEDKTEVFTGVRKFSLIIYANCRDTSIKSFAELLQQNFPDIMKKVKDFYCFLEVLRGMQLLICVDGLDELNEKSRSLLRELLDLFKYHTNVTFIITTRPCYYKKCVEMLESKGIVHLTGHLRPLLTKSEQSEFLLRYQAKLSEVNSAQLMNVFTSMDLTNKLIDLFTRPINLVLFICLFQVFPNVALECQTKSGMMKCTIEYSKKNIIEKLERSGSAKETIIKIADDLLEAANDLSLRSLHLDTMLIEEEMYLKMCKKCARNTIIPWQQLVRCIFRGLPGQAAVEYIDKTHAEYMASKAITLQLKRGPLTNVFAIISRIVGVGVETISPKRFVNVFRFVSIELFETGEHELLLRCLGEILPVLVPEGLDFHNWTELTLDCPPSDIEATTTQAAKLVNEFRSSQLWKLDSFLKMAVATRMLPYHQPRLLSLSLPSSKDSHSKLQPLMQAVGRWFAGTLDVRLFESYWNCDPVDDLLVIFQESRLELGRFTGSLGACPIAAQGLTSAVQRASADHRHSTLFIGLASPRQHQLYGLQGTRHKLAVRARFCPGSRRRCALPRAALTPPRLVLLCSKNVGPKEAAGLIEDLAPDDKRYWSLWLQNWQGTDTALRRLMHVLAAAGIQTPHFGDLRWTVSRTDRDGACSVCASDAHRRGERCVQIKLPVVDMKYQLDVFSSCLGKGGTLETVSSSSLQRADDQARQTLRVFLPEPRLHNIVRLQNLSHRLVVRALFSPTDIESKRRPLPLGSILILVSKPTRSTGQEALPFGQTEAAFPRTAELEVHEQSPTMDGDTPISVDVSQFQLSPGEGNSLALKAVALIEDMSSPAKRYPSLWLQHWQGTNDDLDELVRTLVGVKVRTQDTGVARWGPAGTERSGICSLCETLHQAAQRCVRLRLP